MRSSVALAAVVLSGLLTGSASASTWVSSGPGPAQISSVGFDATQPGVVYVGSRGGGVLRSTDSGLTWARTAPTGDDRIAGISARGGRVIVSRTSDTSGGAGGILRSFDGGATWEAAGPAQGIANPLVDAVAIDPATPDTVLLATNGGLFRSTNAGASWNPVSVPTGTQIHDVLFDPAVPGRVFVASTSGVAVSSDHGASFSLYNQGLGSIQDAHLALDGGTLYAGGFGQLIRTPTAGAAAWADATNGLGLLSTDFVFGLSVTGTRLLAIKNETPFGTDTSFISWSGLIGPGFAVSRFEADPTKTTRVMAAGDGLARSLDSGTTWDRVDAGITGLGVTSVTALASRSTLLATPTGVVRSDDLGATFSRSSAGLSGEIGGRPAVDPSDPSRIFAFAGNALFASTDGGRNWSPGSYGTTNTDGIIAVAPSDGQRLYAAGFNGAVGFVRRSINGGQSWSDANSNGTGGAAFNFARGLAIDKVDAQMAYLSTTDGMRITSDGGDHWATVAGLPTDTRAVTADAATPGMAYVIADDKVWRTTDRGTSWAATTVLPNGVPSDVLVDPRSPATLYVATDVGVFRSPDSGATWTAFSDGLPNHHVRTLAIDRDHAALYAATDAGLAVASLVPPATVTPTPPATPIAAKPKPKPFKATSAYRFPSSRRCLKRPPKLTLTYLRPKGVTVDRFEARIGKKRLLNRTGAKARKSVTLKKLPAKKFTLSIRVTPRGGATASAKKTYRVCAKKRVKTAATRLKHYARGIWPARAGSISTDSTTPPPAYVFPPKLTLLPVAQGLWYLRL